MLKYLVSPPALALLFVLILRGLSADPGAESISANASAPTAPNATATGTAPTTPTEGSRYLSFARLTFDEGVRAIVNARAVELFERAQSEPNALEWIDQHCRLVAGDVGFQRESLGVVTGEAEQFGEFLNRSGELAACAVAQHWLVTGDVPPISAGVNPSVILNQYGAVYSNETKDSQ